MQSNYLCVILQIKRKKLLILNVFTWFLILYKIQDGSQDDDHVWWRYRPPAAPPPKKYTSFCREDERLSTECKIVSKYCNIWKTQGERGGLPPCTTVGYDFVCTFEASKRTYINRGDVSHPPCFKLYQWGYKSIAKTAVKASWPRISNCVWTSFPGPDCHEKPHIIVC